MAFDCGMQYSAKVFKVFRSYVLPHLSGEDRPLHGSRAGAILKLALLYEKVQY